MWLKHITPQILEEAGPVILVILLAGHSLLYIHKSLIIIGTNDSAHAPAMQHASLKEYTQNMNEIIKLLLDKGVAIIVATPPPMSVKKWGAVCKIQDRPLGIATNTLPT